jgi:hypothetical protein
MYHVKFALFHTVSAAVSVAELDSRTANSELLDSTSSTELLDSTGSWDVLEVPPQAPNKATAAAHKMPLKLLIKLPLKLCVAE